MVFKTNSERFQVREYGVGSWHWEKRNRPDRLPPQDLMNRTVCNRPLASCLLQTVPASFPAPFSSTPFVSSYWPPFPRARYGPHVAASFLPSPVVVCCSVACCISRASPCHCPSTTSHPPHPTPQGSVSRSSCLPLKRVSALARTGARHKLSHSRLARRWRWTSQFAGVR